MSWILIALLVVFVLVIFSQFGQRLSAKSAFVWWLISLFLVFCAAFPNSLLPIAQALGFQLPSNFIFASVSLFLLFLAIQASANSTSLSRNLRESICTLAAQRYLEKYAPTPNSGARKRVLIILPTFNEEHSVEPIYRELSGLSNPPQYDIQFCFINDGSTDETEATLSRICPQRFVSHSANTGVAGALMTGFKIAKAANFDYVVQCDADGQHPVAEIPSLVDEAVRSNSDLVIGSRFVNHTRLASNQSTTFARRMGSAVLGLTLKLFSPNRRVSDPTSGFRAYSRRAAQYLSRHLPDEYPEPESVALLLLARMRVDEVQVTMRPRQAGTSSIQGWKSIQFMIKSLSALLGLRLRSWR